MTTATMACALPTKKYPHGRTGTTAGYNAHFRAKEAACEPCMTANTARSMVEFHGADPDDYAEYRQRLSKYRQTLDRGEKALACEKPTHAYPAGRTGTNAGRFAHMAADEAVCEACKKAASERQAAWAKTSSKAAQKKRDAYWSNRDVYLDRNYRSRHGMTLDEYDVMLAAQGGGCAVCGSPDPGGRWGHAGRFHLDHDHKCCPGKNSCAKCRRGLLCSGCNVGLGAFGDDTDKLMAAAAYLLTRKNVLEVAQ